MQRHSDPPHSVRAALAQRAFSKWTLALSLTVLALIGLGGRSSIAQSTLSDIQSLKCRFPINVGVGPWQLGELPGVEVSRDQEFEFHLDSIDVERHSARLIGNIAAIDVAVLDLAAGLHFIEQGESGTLHTLTVFPGDSPPGVYRAVYSRHLVLLGQVIPNQNYGVCEVWD